MTKISRCPGLAFRLTTLVSRPWHKWVIILGIPSAPAWPIQQLEPDSDPPRGPCKAPEARFPRGSSTCLCFAGGNEFCLMRQCYFLKHLSNLYKILCWADFRGPCHRGQAFSLPPHFAPDPCRWLSSLGWSALARELMATLNKWKYFGILIDMMKYNAYNYNDDMSWSYNIYLHNYNDIWLIYTILCVCVCPSVCPSLVESLRPGWRMASAMKLLGMSDLKALPLNHRE